jgi:hypothetical protein
MLVDGEWGVIETLGACWLETTTHRYDSAEAWNGAYDRFYGLEQWKYSVHTDPDLRVLVPGR